ncbi:MAG: hypothetical protein WCF67_16315 [Chitinophagaceae bacterium]
MDKKQETRADERLPGQLPQKQLIPEKGEEYLREAGNIEDLPNTEENEEAERSGR